MPAVDLDLVVPEQHAVDRRMFALVESGARRHHQVYGVTEGGGMHDTVQPRGGRPGEVGARWQVQRERAAAQLMVAIEAAVGEDVVAQARPVVAAQLLGRQQSLPQGVGPAEHLPGQSPGSIDT
ncbi:hypothetical protein Cch02nite_54730 [Catellatospora chokoriensis]|uniref:Uncharacterized protein n=1 Tax=Catellatospora chokoriensis TaxID=310353 RepID=A0A8J3K9P4_9ACTN|nr:hypothetical protein Cch02nite_54730 [Catellatospora chokoriensis]